MSRSNRIGYTKPVDAPNAGELGRAKELAAGLRLAIGRAPRGRVVHLEYDAAVELLQLLVDSLRTAEQLGGTNRWD